MTVSDAQRLKALEWADNRLSNLLAESVLDNAALKNLLAERGKPTGSARGGQDLGRAQTGCDPSLWAGRNLAVAICLLEQAGERYRTDRTPEGNGGGQAALWLPARPCAAAPGG